MRFPKHYVATQDFTLSTPLAPHTYHGRVTNLRWSYTDVAAGDMIKYNPAGVATVYRRGELVEQRSVSYLAVKAFIRAGWITTT